MGHICQPFQWGRWQLVGFEGEKLTLNRRLLLRS